MREAMKNAVVGDDTLRDDPTVLELEELSAAVLGKEAAVFTASGTMSNEIAVMIYCRPGEEVVVFEESHIYNLETGALAALSGVQARPVPNSEGVYDLDALEERLGLEGVQRPKVSLLCLENTYHLNRGLAVPPSGLEPAVRAVRGRGIPVFIDGARLFNAAAALGINPADLSSMGDSVAVCLTKALAAPFGSVLAGSRAFVDEARRMKQRLGGGFRQAGVVAAPAIVALRTMRDRIMEDHENAEVLRSGLEELGIVVDRGGILTNIVYADVLSIGKGAAETSAWLLAEGIKVKVCGPRTLRMVTHRDITSEAVARILERIKQFL
jgi:threonine aldolase